MVNCSGCPCYFDLLVTVSIMNIYFWLICFTSWVLQWLSNLERIIGSSLNWRKRVKPGLRQQRLMKMEKRLTLTFLSICRLHLGILMLRDQ